MAEVLRLPVELPDAVRLRLCVTLEETTWDLEADWLEVDVADID